MCCDAGKLSCGNTGQGDPASPENLSQEISQCQQSISCKGPSQFYLRLHEMVGASPNVTLEEFCCLINGFTAVGKDFCEKEIVKDF